ncbi:AAA-ATPase [Prunus yedoensis var. nudiflora]|uniref:AAA-ATPase n=1 Tax=Prunus yedoensis var. nudiflora TaxID=2094558 RepID=A0A315ALN0_PRUYE|nr:AAA-ATPase [Prunus yedoensis var. nudiflora]
MIFIVEQLMLFISTALSYLSTLFSPRPRQCHDLTLIIHQTNAPPNQVYEAAQLYLPTIDLINSSTRTIQVSKTPRQETVKLAIDSGEQIADTFEDINLNWLYVVQTFPTGQVTRRFELTFHKKHKDKVLTSYLRHVVTRAEAIKKEEKILKLRSVNSITSGSGAPSHVRDDRHGARSEDKDYQGLGQVCEEEGVYKKVGRPGKEATCCMALPALLKRVLLSTKNRSILVIEDIDCTVHDMQNRKSEEPTFTLSGLLNFMDGLWSSCGDERIIVFTTNHKDRLEPALLRPGRMDVHIHMSYCTPHAFKVLASNYLGIQDLNHHGLYGEIAGLLESTEVTPAEVCEQLLKRDDDVDDDDADAALAGLVNFLKLKKLEETNNIDKPETQEGSKC